MKTSGIVLLLSCFVFSFRVLAQQECAGQAPGADICSQFNALCQEADRLTMEGNTNAAISFLKELFDGVSYCRFAAFDRLLNATIAGGNFEDAKACYLGAAEQDKDMARTGYSILRRHYQDRNDPDGEIAWAQALVKADLPPDILLDAHAWFVSASCGKGDYGKALEILPECLRRFDGNSVRGIFAGPIGDMIAAGKTGPAGKMLDEIERQADKHPELMLMAAMERTVMLWKMNKLADAERNFEATAGILPDSEIKTLLARIGAQSANPETAEALGRIHEYVAGNLKGKEGARQFAARSLLASARKSGRDGGIPGRFALLLKGDLPQETLLNLYSMYFYDVAASGNRDGLRSMLASGNILFARLDKPEDKRAVKIYELDGLFIMDDFEAALKLVEENRAIWEKDWAAMAENKVRAHLALQKSSLETGKKQKQLRQEAARRFCENLKYIAKQDDAGLEPVSDLIYTREMLMGFNLKRIGDILQSIGDDAGAAAAFKEAADFYGQALAEADPDTREHAFIRKMLEEIHAAQAKRGVAAAAAE